MSDAPLPGPLDEFLSNPPARPEPAALRRALLLRTSLHVRRRRLVRRLVAAASVAAAILLTAVTIWIAIYGHAAPEAREQPFVEQRKDKPMPPQIREDEKPAGKQTPEQTLLPAVAMEWKAFDAPAAEKTALYLQAGDRYVADGQDLASALRCYGQAVKTAPAEALAIDPDDNWLVMALKMDQIERRQEK
jgi:hypothetical protein